jgi:hypothetical protein
MVSKQDFKALGEKVDMLSATAERTLELLTTLISGRADESRLASIANAVDSLQGEVHQSNKDALA